MQTSGAQQKGRWIGDEPVSVPMRPTRETRRSPSADQLKARRLLRQKSATVLMVQAQNVQPQDMVRVEGGRTVRVNRVRHGGPGMVVLDTDAGSLPMSATASVEVVPFDSLQRAFPSYQPGNANAVPGGSTPAGLVLGTRFHSTVNDLSTAIARRAASLIQKETP